jgi:hypothetical protein
MTAGLTLCLFASGDVIVARDDPAANATAVTDERLLRVDGKSVLISDSERLARRAH